MKKFKIELCKYSYFRIYLIIPLLFIEFIAYSQEMYKPDVKNRTKGTYTIETEEGEKIPVKVTYVNGAIIYGGDIVLQPEGISTAIGVKKYRRWLHGIIPYKIVENHPCKSNIVESINILNASTVLTYIEYETFKRDFAEYITVSLHGSVDYINIINGDGCYSGIGKPAFSSHYDLSIGDGCCSIGIIIHELLHAAGLYHEQSRFDRDKYVTILWDNIIEKEKDNFEIPPKWLAKNIHEYNYNSVMHYSCTDFTDNNKPTIFSLSPIGQRTGLSQGDIDAIKSMYYNAIKAIPTQISLPKLEFPPKCGVECTEILRKIKSVGLAMKKREEEIKKQRIQQGKKDDIGGTVGMWPSGARKVGAEKGLYIIFEENLLKDTKYKKLYEERQLLLHQKKQMECP